jgi:hypothetical protein
MPKLLPLNQVRICKRRRPGQYKRENEKLAEHGMKRCGSCRQIKTVSSFCKSKNAWDGRYGYCRECNSPRMTNAYLMRTYKITFDRYVEIAKSQGNVCAICKKPETMRHLGNKILRLAVDHNHDTGAIRGLLCNRCNCAIAGFENLVRDGVHDEAMDYLNRHSRETLSDPFGEPMRLQT